MNFQPPDPPDFGNCPTCRTGIEREQLRGDKCTERECDTVATTHTCELGEHCRCKSYDVAYQQDCWNWIGLIL